MSGIGDRNDVKIETLTKVFCVRGRFLAQQSIRGVGRREVGSIISRAKRESLLFTFFCPPCKKEKAKAKTLPNKNNSATRIRGVSKSSRIARTDRSRREFERSFLIYCGRQLTESASVTLTDSRTRNRVGGERFRDGEHSIRIKKSEREKERKRSVSNIHRHAFARGCRACYRE